MRGIPPWVNQAANKDAAKHRMTLSNSSKGNTYPGDTVAF
jgi:hypothetical protein